MLVAIYRYWQEPPPEPSAGLRKWVSKVKAGWQPNRRIRTLGYSGKADFFQVYIWEWINVLSPLMDEREVSEEALDWMDRHFAEFRGKLYNLNLILKRLAKT